MTTSDLADEYFNRALKKVEGTPRADRPVCYAIFARTGGVLCGVTDVLGLINARCTGPVTVRGKRDGDRFGPREIIMTIEGRFADLVVLETEYLGMLSLTGAATNMAAIVEAAGETRIIDMAARHYPPEMSEYIGVAAAVGGAAGTCTRIGHTGAHERFGVGEGLIQVGGGPARRFELYGSIPHALNAVFEGSSIESAAAYHERHPDIPLSVLIDFEGRERDIVAEAVRRFGPDLYAVRLDTPASRVHQGGHETPNRAMEMRILAGARDRGAAQAALDRYGFGPGVTIEMVFNIRDLLNQLGARSTQIIASSGFDLEKVKAFKACGAPVDAIGTGSWVGFTFFTSDIIRVQENGTWVERCKAGRREELFEPELPVLLQK